MAGPECHSDEEYEIVEGMKSTEKMNIFHTTHEAAIGGRSTRRPSSATQKIKDYFSIRTHGSSRTRDEDEEVLIPLDLKPRERRASETKVGHEDGLCAFLIKEHKELRRKHRKKEMVDASKIRGEKERVRPEGSGHGQSGKKPARAGTAGYGRLQDTMVRSPAVEMRAPTLKRKDGFENLKGVDAQADTNEKAHEYMNRLRAQRQAISEGKLEKVIPPSSSGKSRLTLKHQNVPPGKTSHSKSSSTSSRLGSYIGTSADLLDATRRDLTLNLRKSAEKAEKALSSKFDHLGRYSSGHGNNWDDDSDSDESFCCIGERRWSQLERARRVSGNGKDPWTDGLQKECRLCRKPSPAGVRGLCRECEDAFRRPKTTALDDSEDEMKPPPPLKIKKTKKISAQTHVMARNIHNPFSNENVGTSKFNQVEKKPQLVTPGSHISQHVYIDDGCNTPESETDYVSKYERWQSPDLRAQYQSQENEGSRWSPRLMDDNEIPTPPLSLRSRFSKVRNLPTADEDTSPLVAREGEQSNRPRKANGTNRNNSFYRYWDEILKDQETKNASLTKRDNRYNKF